MYQCPIESDTVRYYRDLDIQDAMENAAEEAALNTLETMSNPERRIDSRSEMFQDLTDNDRLWRMMEAYVSGKAADSKSDMPEDLREFFVNYQKDEFINQYEQY